ncbi:YgaP family membrane protein [Leptospira yasudae]|uniref:DUF2892 domain-containing protein n=1 Tax=Leptospira yasudae TaxID=2202201 RepID=A0A6N4QQ41_9LEPT|nr:DUF2892 domain-containing protein [Leptospira yasudae]TGL78046.1 DUF2892 domain-containing protein [Leptospira yasudae]TGL81330.1 DUF2892 domain-containing protein [Leptospira yasudae]TGL81492.1 DUF2892 domain-containing protein [Leptospira yasudae]
MQINEGTIDRIIRIVLGIALIGFGYATQGVIGNVMLVAGFVPLGTGILGWCPLYSVFGFNTCPMKK